MTFPLFAIAMTSSSNRLTKWRAARGMSYLSHLDRMDLLEEVEWLRNALAQSVETVRSLMRPVETCGDIPTDGQFLDQLEDAFYKADSGYVEQDVALRRELANLLVRYNRDRSPVETTCSHQWDEAPSFMPRRCLKCGLISETTPVNGTGDQHG